MESTTNACSVCFDDVDVTSNGSIKMPCCKQWFHESCIGKWSIRGTFTCPVCRGAMDGLAWDRSVKRIESVLVKHPKLKTSLDEANRSWWNKVEKTGAIDNVRECREQYAAMWGLMIEDLEMRNWCFFLHASDYNYAPHFASIMESALVKSGVTVCVDDGDVPVEKVGKCLAVITCHRSTFFEYRLKKLVFAMFKRHPFIKNAFLDKAGATMMLRDDGVLGACEIVPRRAE